METKSKVTLKGVGHQEKVRVTFEMDKDLFDQSKKLATECRLNYSAWLRGVILSKTSKKIS